MGAPGGIASRRSAASLARAALERPWDLAFVALALVHLAPLWAVTRFATQDGPAHVENAVALLRLGRDPLLAEFYELGPDLVPNLFGHGLVALFSLAGSPVIAEKLVLSGYVLALPLAFRHALPPRARARGFALAAFPFVYSYPLHMGFVNFCWGIALLLAAAGMWQRRRGRLGAAPAAALGAVSAVVALAHGLAFLVLAGVLATFLATRAGRGLARARGARRRRLAALHARLALPTAIALTPGAALVGAFLLGPSTGTAWLPLGVRLGELARLSALVAVHEGEGLVAGALAGAILAAALAAGFVSRRRIREAGWLAAALGAATLAAAAPERLGNVLLLTIRLQLFPYLFALVWIGSQPRLPRAVRALPAVAALASAATLAWRAPTYALLDEHLDELVSVAPHLAPGTTVLPLVLTLGKVLHGGEWVPFAYGPFLHAAAYVVVLRGGVDLDNYEAHVGHFPLRFRPGRDPFDAPSPGLGLGLDGIEGFPPCVDLAGRPGGVRVDNVIVWGSPDGFRGHPCVAAWTAQLERGFERVFVSGRGWASLWRRR